MKLNTRSFILRGTCRIIPRAAAAIMRIATRPKSSTSTAISTRGAGKTGSTSSSLHGRLSAIGIIPMAETTSALHHPTASTRLTPCSASHWEAAYEIRRSEWQDTQPAVFLRVVLRTDRRELPNIRELTTRLSYCDHGCYVGHAGSSSKAFQDPRCLA